MRLIVVWHVSTIKDKYVTRRHGKQPYLRILDEKNKHRITDKTVNKLSCHCSDQDVRIPSPLQTARVKLYESTEDNKTPRYINKPKYYNTTSTPPNEPHTSSEQPRTQRSQSLQPPGNNDATNCCSIPQNTIKKGGF